MILVTGSVLANPETFDEILAASLAHVQRSRAEPGCIAHNVHQDAEHPLRLVFVEEWEDRAALLAHFAVPESRAFAKTIRALAAEPPVLKIFDATPVQFG
ncbi:MAG: antibiotic biosynthesis monooxygenase [Acidobacteria bacterium]|nr:antibiotic biosynthesis monooxygenase [Acidobacteriota bacterium]